MSTRREFLITAGTGLAVSFLHPRFGGAQGAGLRIRKNVVSAAAQSDLNSLRKGVAEMKKLIQTQPNDPRGWILQAFIHGDCTKFTFCQHGNWYFPPWHRSFIYYFEQLIQCFSSDPNFALPYWDWSRTTSVPESFYGAGNPLDDDISISSSCTGAPAAGRGVAATTHLTQADLDTYVGPNVINRIQGNPDFATYGGGNPGRGELEGTPHNFIHRWVGGTASGGRKVSNMVQTFSPLDPIFWLHHCNIDRLYSNWLSRPNHNPPAESQWRDKSFNDFYDCKGNRAGTEFTCARTLDSRNMGYVYDQALAMPEALAVQRKAVSPRVIGEVASSKGAIKAGVLSFVSEAAPAAETLRSMNAAAGGAGNYVVRLRVDGVKVPRRQSTGVYVFLGPDVTAETPITAPGYVGSFTFFDGEGASSGSGEHHHGSSDFLLNATKAVQELYGDISLPTGASLSVSVVTRPLAAGAGAFATVEEIRPDRIQIEVVDLGA